MPYADALAGRSIIRRRVKVASVCSLALGLRAGYFIYWRHEVLVPDSFRFASGGAAWSSPAGATLGHFFGIGAVQGLGFVGSCMLGAVVGFFLADRVRWASLFVLFALSPPGWYTFQASVDAIGAALVVLALLQPGKQRTCAVAVLVLLFHVVAFLCLFGALVNRRVSGRVSWFPLVGVGLGVQIAFWHMQARYCLPGAAMCAVEIGSGVVGAPVYVQRLRSGVLGCRGASTVVRKRTSWSLSRED